MALGTAAIVAVAACLASLAEGEGLAFSLGAGLGSLLLPAIVAGLVVVVSKAKTVTNASLVVFAGVAVLGFLAGLAG